MTQVRLRAGRAKLHARRGELDAAAAEARAAVELAERTEYVDLRGDALLALGEVLQLTGRDEEGLAAIAAAQELWEAKGNVAWAMRAQTLRGRVDLPTGGGFRER